MDTDQILIERFIDQHPLDALRILEESSVPVITEILESLSPETAIKLIPGMDRKKASDSFEKMEPGKVKKIISGLPMQVTALILRQMSPEKSGNLLNSFPRELSTSIRLLLDFSEDSIGAWMNPGILGLSDEITVAKSLELIKQDPEHYLSTICLISRDQKFLGTVTIKSLLTSEGGKIVSDLMDKDFDPISAKLKIESLLDPENKLNISHSILPVIDQDGLYLGMLDLQKLKNNYRMKGRDVNQARKTSQALGDLYRIGLSGIFMGATEIITESKSRKDG